MRYFTVSGLSANTTDASSESPQDEPDEDLYDRYFQKNVTDRNTLPEGGVFRVV